MGPGAYAVSTEKPYEFVYRAHIQPVLQEGNVAMNSYNIAPVGAQTAHFTAGAQDFLTSFPAWFMFATFATTRAMYEEDPENYGAFFNSIVDGSGTMTSVPTIQIGTQPSVLQQWVPIDSQVYKDIITPVAQTKGGFWRVLGESLQISCGSIHPFIRPSVSNPYLCCVCSQGFDPVAHACIPAADAHNDCYTSPSRCDQNPAFFGCTTGTGGGGGGGCSSSC